MTEAHPERSTFLTLDEVLTDLHRRNRRFRARLIDEMRQRDPSLRVELFLETLDRQRTELEEKLEAGLAEGRREGVLDVYTQYTSAVPLPDTALPDYPIVGDIVRWILDLGRRTSHLYRTLADGLQHRQSREFLRSLQDIVESHGKEVARATQAFPDS